MKLELLLGRQVEFVCNNMVIEAVRARVKEAAIASATGSEKPELFVSISLDVFITHGK